MSSPDGMKTARAAIGRPLGSCNLGSKQLSGLAIAFKKHGFDWRGDFCKAVQARDYKLMAFYLKLMPFLTTQNPGYRKNAATKGYTPRGTSKAKLEGLDAQEQALRDENPGGLKAI